MCVCVGVGVCVTCVRGWVGACVHTGGCMFVCADGCSKVATLECMFNTSCTQVSAKEVGYPLVPFSLKVHFYIPKKTIT